MADLITELSRIKTACSVSVLALLLAWESWTPFMHKVHHSRWQPETDSNYSSLFSFWDRLFGTLRMREDPRTLRYGLEEFDPPKHHTMTGLLITPFREVARIRPPEDTEAASESAACPPATLARKSRARSRRVRRSP
jgi:hypothetical protein